MSDTAMDLVRSLEHHGPYFQDPYLSGDGEHDPKKCARCKLEAWAKRMDGNAFCGLSLEKRGPDTWMAMEAVRRDLLGTLGGK